MADADLDVVIRQLARQLHTGLMTRAKQRRDRFNELAAKAKGKEARDRFKQMAKATMESTPNTSIEKKMPPMTQWRPLTIHQAIAAYMSAARTPFLLNWKPSATGSGR